MFALFQVWWTSLQFWADVMDKDQFSVDDVSLWLGYQARPREGPCHLGLQVWLWWDTAACLYSQCMQQHHVVCSRKYISEIYVNQIKLLDKNRIKIFFSVSWCEGLSCLCWCICRNFWYKKKNTQWSQHSLPSVCIRVGSIIVVYIIQFAKTW